MHPRRVLAIGNFLSVAHFYLVIYIIGPFLATHFPANQAGLAVSLGAVITIAVFPFVPWFVHKIGARKLAVILASFVSVVLLLLSSYPGPLVAFLLIALVCATSPLIAYQLDLLLQATMQNTEETGRIRSAFLTAGSIALVLAPLTIGFLLDGGNSYGRVFVVAACSLAPFIVLLLAEPLPELVPSRTHRMRATLKYVFGDTDLRATTIAQGVLQFLYHLAPLYVPLYLHTALGFPWSDLGWMFALMLVPFPLIEYPAGYIADRWLGDKEMLVIGFVIMGISFALLAFVTGSTPLWLILAILVINRVGSALVEAMTEGHFFRRIKGEDENVVSLFRSMRPGAALIAPIIASALLFTGSYAVLFLVTGTMITIAGVWSALAITDVK